MFENELQKGLKDLPNTIGIFDSGIGGISVLNALVYYPHITSIVYVADTAYMPYGNKSYEVLLERGCFITEFFIRNNITTIVVACHTASAIILKQLRHLYPEVHFIDLLFMTVERALSLTHNKKIGVLATINTINSAVHTRMIHALQPDVQVTLQACPELVPLLEAAIIDKDTLHSFLALYLQSMLDAQVDTLILGCTHYPFLHTYCNNLFTSFKFLVSAYHCIVPSELQSSHSDLLSISFYVTGSVSIFTSKVSVFANSKVHSSCIMYHSL